ncbi:unnamed protein product, partial [Mesorhabditis spiculigera]
MLVLSQASERHSTVRTRLTQWAKKSEMSSADQMLENMAEMDGMSAAEAARTINLYVARRPEIIEPGPYIVQQTRSLFTAKHSAVTSLCVKLAHSVTPETLETVMRYLSSSYDPKLNAGSVFGLFSYCACEGKVAMFKEMTDAQLKVLAHYVCAAVVEDPIREEAAVLMIDALVTALGFPVLRPLVQSFVDQTKAVIYDRARFEQLQSVKADWAVGYVAIQGQHWRMKEADVMMTQTLNVVFTDEDPAKIERALAQLESWLKSHPKSMERLLVAFAIRAIFVLVPKVEASSLDHVEALLSVTSASGAPARPNNAKPSCGRVFSTARRTIQGPAPCSRITTSRFEVRNSKFPQFAFRIAADLQSDPTLKSTLADLLAEE